MKTALVIGSEGQDGTLLQLLLLEKGYRVLSVGRKRKENGLTMSTVFFPFNLETDSFESIAEFIIGYKPDEIYYVAAFHASSQEVQQDINSIDSSGKVNYLSFVKVLELCRLYSLSTRIVYTSSSLIFAGASNPVQDEFTELAPRCIYSVNKCAAMTAARYYRDVYGLFVSVGIMYNHESKLRNRNFLSQIVISGVRKYIAGEIDKVVVGDLSLRSDWGYAPDYVRALWHILQQEKAQDFIVASGTSHSVQDWFETIFTHLGLDWHSCVEEDKTRVFRKKPLLIGNPTKLMATGWHPETSFAEMIIRMYNDMI